jgi:hypothetical protein
VATANDPGLKSATGTPASSAAFRTRIGAAINVLSGVRVRSAPRRLCTGREGVQRLWPEGL